jgi:hypothetical protein
MADSDSGGGGGAKRNVVSSNFTSRNERGKKEIMGREGTTTIIQEDARKQKSQSQSRK